MSQPLRLLVVEDVDDDYQILARELARGGFDVTSERVASGAELAAALERPWDLVITDWAIPGFGGLHTIELVRGRDLPCIVVSGTPNEEDAMTAIHAGALDFISKDRPRRFAPAVDRALREDGQRRARIAAERELRLSEERYRSVFDAAPEAVYTFDIETGLVVDANRAALRLFARSLDELHAVRFGDLSAPTLPDGRSSREVGSEVVARLMHGADLAPFEWVIARPSGEQVPVEMHIARLTSEGRHLVRITAIDLRQRRKLEEVRRRTIDLELQNRRIQEANRLKSEFLANMSHELRTPLNAIIGFSELLHDGQVPAGTPEHTEFLGDILTSSRHLLQLINDVLDLAKVEAGKLDFRPEDVDLGKLIAEIVAITRTTSAVKRITVVAEVDATITGVVLDPGRFKQIAYNYLSNALKFTPDFGKVTIRIAREDDQHFRLEVEDTGVGISQADQARLFVEFEQLEPGAAKRHQGTGLGLALSKRLVEAQGGSVGVRSTPGAGSVFHAVLPMCADPLDPASKMAPTTRMASRTVLIVEDDDRDRELIATSLARAGYGFELARTGAEAVARCRERIFDAITLDLLLPDMSGVDVLESLRVGGLIQITPVIVVTIVPDVRIDHFAVSSVLRKPLDADALLAALERAGVRPGKSEVQMGEGT